MKKLLLIALMVSGLAFVPVQRSDVSRNWNSGNWDWTGRQLRLSPFRVLFPRGGLLPATRLWVCTEDRHTIRITGIECIPVTTVIICIKPRWAQSARFDEIIFWLAFA